MGATTATVPEQRRTLVHVVTVAASLDFLRGQLGYVGAHGFDVHVVASGDPSLMARFLEAEGAIPHLIPMSRVMTPLLDLLSLWRLWLLLGRLSPAVVHAGTPKGGLLGILAASVRHVPVRIYHMHGIRGMTSRGWRRKLLMTTEWLACRLATRVLCVSVSTRDSALAARLCKPEKIVVLGHGSCNGVDAVGRFAPERITTEQRRVLKAELNIPAESRLIGFVGRVTREKGVVELAEAWQHLAAAFNDLHLLVIGPIEAEDPVPTEALNFLRLHPRSRLVPAVSDPAPYYAIMDVVALPTYREGLPNVPLEAAAMALPVVATRVPGCVDAIVDGVTGTLVSPHAVEPLVAALRAYLEAPQLRKEHGANGRERVLRDFIPQTIWRDVLALYQSELLRATSWPR